MSLTPKLIHFQNFSHLNHPHQETEKKFIWIDLLGVVKCVSLVVWLGLNSKDKVG